MTRHDSESQGVVERVSGSFGQSPQAIIIAFVLVATLIAGFAAPAAGFAIFVLGLLAALVFDFNGWKQGDDAGDRGRSPLGLMEPLGRQKARPAEEASDDPGQSSQAPSHRSSETPS